VKIQESDLVNISKPQSERLSETPNASSSSSRAVTSQASTTDRIDLGSQLGLVSQAQSAGTDSTAARIEQLRALVQSGQYQVDNNVLSRSIVDGTLKGD
jgi:anti-sigma28 factor (negative regulator of flagellin synthesis)